MAPLPLPVVPRRRSCRTRAAEVMPPSAPPVVVPPPLARAVPDDRRCRAARRDVPPLVVPLVVGLAARRSWSWRLLAADPWPRRPR